MKFRDYRTAYDDFRKQFKSYSKRENDAYLSAEGIDASSYKSVYAWQFKQIKGNDTADHIVFMRLVSEASWYQANRPYFNVYPVIERKFLELNADIKLSELHLPFNAIEVRTKDRTVFMSDAGHAFFFVCDFPDGTYQEFMCGKGGTLKAVDDAPYMEIDGGWNRVSGGQTLTDRDRKECIYIAAGTCLLAKDENIVRPVVLAADYKDYMSDEDIKRYSEKAKRRTGRVGFEVGKVMQKMQASIHYRNGCFAKYYVGKTHQAYPDNAESNLAPIIQWRSGAVVNKDNIPKIPTGFKDTADSWK